MWYFELVYIDLIESPTLETRSLVIRFQEQSEKDQSSRIWFHWMSRLFCYAHISSAFQFDFDKLKYDICVIVCGADFVVTFRSQFGNIILGIFLLIRRLIDILLKCRWLEYRLHKFYVRTCVLLQIKIQNKIQIKSLVWCPGQNKRIAPLSFLHGCRKRRL
jgi:hypothetical protein